MKRPNLRPRRESGFAPGPAHQTARADTPSVTASGVRSNTTPRATRVSASALARPCTPTCDGTPRLVTTRLSERIRTPDYRLQPSTGEWLSRSAPNVHTGRLASSVRCQQWRTPIPRHRPDHWSPVDPVDLDHREAAGDIIPGSRPRVVVRDLEQWLDAHKLARGGTQPRPASAEAAPTVTTTNGRRESRRARPQQSAQAKRLRERAERYTQKRSAAEKQ